MEELIDLNTYSAYFGKDIQSNSFRLNHSQEAPILDVVLPAYNEADTIRKVVSNFNDEIITKLPSRLVVAEDGSYDGTKEILQSLKDELSISLFSTPVRKGYTRGVGDALKRCNAPWIFFSDSDGQYSPSSFWQLWENRGEYDMIIGRKLHRSEGIHRTILSKGFHGITNNLFGLKLHDADCGFRLIRKSLIDSVLGNVNSLEYSFWAELTIRASLQGFRILEVPITHASRENGGTRIYKPSKIPLIVIKQLKGLVELYSNTRKMY
jgi:dolichol-phosphate mannosyltransferase